MRTFVKFSGLVEPSAIALVPEGGAAGFVIGVDDSPRNLTPARAAELVSAVPNGAEVWAITRNPSAEMVHTMFDEVGVDRIEVFGKVPEGLEFLETHHIVPTIPMPAPGSGGAPPAVPAPEVHPILRLDSAGDVAGTGSPTRPDWEACRALVDRHPGRKIVLAGGLDAAVVEEALLTVRPWGVDVSAGIESSPAKLDPAKVAAFLAAVARAESAGA